MTRQRRVGFSLVEVVIALAVTSFALLTLAALLPSGIISNKLSVQETTGAGILTMLEADLRNTHPLLNNGKSEFFGLNLPYSSDASGNYSENSGLSLDTLGAAYTTGVNKDGSAVAASSVPPALYQATVVFLSIPGGPPPINSLAPVEARLIVNWPCLNTTTVSDLTNPSKVSGFVDAYVTFPAP